MYRKDLFKDKVVMVSGGRSGIGFDIAKRFLNLGAKLMICSRKDDLLKNAAADLSKFGECEYKSCDIREMEQVKALAAYHKEKFGRLDVLINNAGGQFPALAENISPNGWSAVINNNLNGTFFMSQTMAKEFFMPQIAGVIVNIIANVHRGFPGMVHTGAARAGVENMTKTLAQEWARFGIRINSIAPGTILSSGLDTYIEPIKEIFTKVKENNLMNRLGTVEDVSNAVCFLASPLSSYTSGTTLYVDGMDHLSAPQMGFVDFLKSME